MSTAGPSLAALAAGAGVGLAVLVATARPPGPDRLAGLAARSRGRPGQGRPAGAGAWQGRGLGHGRGHEAGAGAGTGSPAGTLGGGASAPDDQPVRGRGLSAVAASVAVLLMVGGTSGLLAAVVAGPLVHHLLRRLEPRSVVARREQVARDLPVAAHLLGAAVGAGASPLAAVETVAASLGGPLQLPLRRIAATARLGGDLAASWRAVADDPGIGPLARTVGRALETGAPLAHALDRLATDLRSQQRFEVDRLARSVGVRAAAPLGLCFLPGFLLVGVVPVVVGVAGGILGSLL